MTTQQSVVIPYHRDPDMIRYCLKTMMKFLPDDVEIVVVGNNVSAREIDITLPDRVRYFKVYENLLYSAAINYGVRQAKGEIITLCDPDTFYFETWYEPLLDTLLGREDVGAVSSKLINPLTGRILDFGMSFTKWNIGHPTKGLPYNHPLTRGDRIVQAACSAVLMTRREHFEAVGGMDEDMPFAYPDCDYCLKLNELGLKTWVLSSSNVYHKGSSDNNNSKYYAHGYLRVDCKGMFYAKNFHRIKEDLHEWFAHTAKWAQDRWPALAQSYSLLDFTTIYNRDYYYRALQDNGFALLDRKVVPVRERDIPCLSLYSHISMEYLGGAVPLLYFVDTFTSLLDNHLWFSMRDISGDAVVDRHGNIFPLTELAAGAC